MNIVMRYTNYEGKTSLRRIEPLTVWFGKTAWHPDPQWFLAAIDWDKEERRDFALKDCDFTVENVI